MSPLRLFRLSVSVKPTVENKRSALADRNHSSSQVEFSRYEIKDHEGVQAEQICRIFEPILTIYCDASFGTHNNGVSECK